MRGAIFLVILRLLLLTLLFLVEPEQVDTESERHEALKNVAAQHDTGAHAEAGCVLGRKEEGAGDITYNQCVSGNQRQKAYN